MDLGEMMSSLMNLNPEGDEGMDSIRGYKKWRGLPLGYVNGDDLLNNIESIKFRPSDIIIFTYPKCGTTFLSDLTVDLLAASGKIKPDYKPVYPLDLGINSNTLNEAPEDVPRIVFTHLRWEALPKELKQGNHKMISITRNPKDAFCSMYPFVKRMRVINEQMSMDKFLELFTTDRAHYGDYFKWHKQWLAHRFDSNLLSLCFEDMKVDLASSVQLIKDHLNLDLTDEQLEQVTQKNQFNAKKAAAKPGLESQHLRKGKAGGWKEELSAEQISKLDAWIDEGMEGLEGFELKF